MKRNAAELRLLVGAEFNQILAADPELQRLEALKNDRSANLRQMFELFDLGDYRIGKLPVRPLTAAKWCFLWLIENRYATGGQIREIDSDAALYVLSRFDLRELGDTAHTLWEIPAAASGYARATGLSPQEITREIVAWRDAAFRPLELLPPAGQTDEPGFFDADWLVKICAIAARESNETLEHVMHKFALSTVCSLFVAWSQRESANPRLYRRRLRPELAEQIDERVDQLAEEFLTRVSAERGHRRGRPSEQTGADARA